MLGDLDRRLAVELLEKAYSANTHYVDPSDVEQDDESVGVPAVTMLFSHYPLPGQWEKLFTQMAPPSWQYFSTNPVQSIASGHLASRTPSISTNSIKTQFLICINFINL